MAYKAVPDSGRGCMIGIRGDGMSGPRTRSLVLLVLIVVAGCSGGGTEQSARQPGLRVAEEALRAGSAQMALQVAQGILSRVPNNVPALLVQGDAQTLLGRSDDAAASFIQALKLEPTSVHAKIGLGRVRLATNPAEAETLFQEVLEQEPRNANALNNLGIARDLLGRHAEAQEAYRRIPAINPDMSAAQVNLALSLAMSGDTAAALRIIEPIATAPDATSKIRHDYAAVLALAGRDSDAEQILRQDMSPEDVGKAMDVYHQQRQGNQGTVPSVPVSLPAAPARPQSNAFPSDRPTTIAASTTPASQAGTPGQLVQLGTFPSEDAAKAKWRALRKKFPDVLAGHQPRTVTTAQDGKVRWRLMTEGFAAPASMREFCGKLRSIGAACRTSRAQDVLYSPRVASAVDVLNRDLVEGVGFEPT
jgi:Flp pilus assembly protein TadD